MAVLDHLRVGIEEYEAYPSGPGLLIAYIPIIESTVRGELRESFGFRMEAGPIPDGAGDLVARWNALHDSVQRFGVESLIVDGSQADLERPLLEFAVVSGGDTPEVYLTFGKPGQGFAPSYGSFLDRVLDGRRATPPPTYYEKLTASERRLVDSILVTATNLAWADLRAKWKLAPVVRRQVFISYRSGNEAFAEGLAERLGAEGFIPLFDRWEIRAGDSVPGKIEEGLRTSVAFIPVLTADYQEGKWATEELESAISKRIDDQGFSIVPVLLEQCQKPELIRHLRHVDFSDHDPEKFESRVAEVIDGINRLSKNPFRCPAPCQNLIRAHVTSGLGIQAQRRVLFDRGEGNHRDAALDRHLASDAAQQGLQLDRAGHLRLDDEAVLAGDVVALQHVGVVAQSLNTGCVLLVVPHA